jgi:hypothetical protein
MSLGRIVGALAVGALLSLGSTGVASAAPAPVALGTAGAFAVLAGATVTSAETVAGASTVNGDLGVSPGTAVTGFPPATLNGTLHAGDVPAAGAHTDLATAYAYAAARSPATTIPADLGGTTLDPGVYQAAAASIAITGTVTLDAQGDPKAVFILQAGSTLITAAKSQVILANGAQACNVFWSVGSSATLGASSLLTGTILATTSITVGAGVTVAGRTLARDAAVTLDSQDTVTAPQCIGPLSNAAPAIAPFTARLTGLDQTVHTTLGAWSVTDARGTDAGYSVSVSASAPTVNGSPTAAGTGGSITLTPSTATAASGNSATTGPVAALAQPLSTTPVTIDNAPAGTGQGEWDFAADTVGSPSLAIIIPGNVSAGTYSSTLTFTTAPPAT